MLLLIACDAKGKHVPIKQKVWVGQVALIRDFTFGKAGPSYPGNFTICPQCHNICSPSRCIKNCTDSFAILEFWANHWRLFDTCWGIFPKANCTTLLYMRYTLHASCCTSERPTYIIVLLRSLPAKCCNWRVTEKRSSCTRDMRARPLPGSRRWLTQYCRLKLHLQEFNLLVGCILGITLVP